MRILYVLAACLALPACGTTRALPAANLNPGPEGRYDYGYDEDWGGYGREDGYVGVSALYSIEQFDPFPLTLGGTPLSSSVDDSPGFGVRGGYRLSKEFAVEAAVDRVLGHEVSIRIPGPFGTVTEDLDTWNAGVQGKYYLAYGSVQPFLLAGAGWTKSEFGSLSDSGAYIRAGAGADFYLDKDVAVFFEASWNTGGEIEGVDLDHLDAHVGLLFWF